MKKVINIIVSILLVIATVGISVFAVAPNYTVSSSYKSGSYYQNLLNVKLTGNQATDIVNVALSQVGYHEGSSASNLSGNSTSQANYTEYGRWFGQQGNWCAMFISWCASQANIPSSVIKKNANASGSSCQYGEKQYKFGSRSPKVGDIIYIQNDSDSAVDHVGLIYKVDDTYIYSVEGNFGHKVGTIKYYKNSGKQTYYSSTKILFYGVPDYSKSTTTTKTTTTTTKATTTKATTTTVKPTTTTTTAAVVTTTLSANTVILGDINGDKKVNSIDALNILEYSVGNRIFTQEQKKYCDVDGDSLINANDALYILKIATGQIN